MDLRNNQITVGELLDDPRSLAVFRRRFGRWLGHPMVQQSRSLTLQQLIQMAGAVLPPSTIRQTLEDLRQA